MATKSQELIKLSQKLNKIEQQKREIQSKIRELLQEGQPSRFQPNSKVQRRDCPPARLAKILKIDPDVEINRYQLTKKLYTYMEQRGMIDPEHRGTIEPSNKIRRALMMDPDDDDLNLFNLQTYLTRVYAAE
jgi:hypothetical protein